jgi:transcriptional regulator with XRE-family HTH domain
VKSTETDQHRALARLLVAKRQAAGLRQRDVAERLHRYQSWVDRIEAGQRRIDVVEFFAIARAIGFDPIKALKELFSR